MKRLTWLFAAVLLILTVAACGKKSESSGNDANSAEGNSAETAMIPGTLNPINLKEGEKALLKGLRLVGNRAGGTESDEAFNNKPLSTEGIRCIFELNEWVEVYPEIDNTNSIGLWVFEHREEQSSYEKITLSDAVQGFVTFTELEKPESNNDPWGSFYLNSEEAKEGYYDFIFTINGKPAAALLTRFYKEEALANKTDAELEQIQKGLEAVKVK